MDEECRHGINPEWCATCLSEMRRKAEFDFQKKLAEAIAESPYEDLIPDV